MKAYAEHQNCDLDMRPPKGIRELEESPQIPDCQIQDGCSEEDPKKTDQVEKDEDFGCVPPAEGQVDRRAFSADQSMGDEEQTVQSPPDHEGPIGSMPQAAQEHGKGEV